ncbi:DNA-binding transcriptional regulator, MarR family [Cohaesibacter sp. ES.047]|uniref:MarR family winged helix-turn-helix transcriptional regulator n=1 Tax=Cohaesibacter sp. ES.047 TaxID=1798205 RepID=UPI000BBF7E8F|nr:MarR family transcriptional regulator [Cohaesibacter sp. ES.047]SNY90163.1 DNA-binding transcriptional regulator, MarR family [Cohaesibacter sp. ES.047]
MPNERGEHEEKTIGFLLKQLNDGTKQMVDAKLQPFGLTMTQAQFLYFLRTRMGKTTTPKHFEEHFGIAHPTVVGVLKRLEQKELIAAMPDPEDGRRKIITLAPAEQQIHRQVQATRQTIEACLIDKMTPQEVADLKIMLERLLANIQD